MRYDIISSNTSESYLKGVRDTCDFSFDYLIFKLKKYEFKDYKEFKEKLTILIEELPISISLIQFNGYRVLLNYKTYPGVNTKIDLDLIGYWREIQLEELFRK